MSDTEILLFNSSSKQARKGLTRRAGKCVFDDLGVTHPFGITFYWGLSGWKNERPRTEKNISFISKYCDYITIICDVTWGAHSDWPDFEDQLSNLIDTTYDKYGMKVYLLLEGDRDDDPFTTVDKVINVVKPRVEKVIAIECWNEYARDSGDINTIKQMYQKLNSNLPNLIALTSPDPFNYSEVIDATNALDAQLLSIHRGRSDSDYGWRNVRQCWDFKDYPQVVADSEPAGPHSSIYSETNLVLLSMMRIGAHMCGAAMHQVHIADMVGGIVDPHYGRVANIWEVKDADLILSTLRNLDKLIPSDVENWTRKNDGKGNPFLVDGFWPDGYPNGVNRNYSADNGHEFICCLLGVKNIVQIQVLRPLVGKVYDPISLNVVEELDGSNFELLGNSDTRTGYVIKGNYL